MNSRLAGTTMSKISFEGVVALKRAGLISTFQTVNSARLHIYMVRSISFPGSSPQCSLGEPLTRAIRTITLALSWWRHAPRVTPKWPVTQAGHLGLTQLSPWNDVKAIRTFRGQTGVDPGKLDERTHSKRSEKINKKILLFQIVVCFSQ